MRNALEDLVYFEMGRSQPDILERLASDENAAYEYAII
jgi:hypothetical protein